MVLRRCRKLLGDEQRALDALQDVFARLIDLNLAPIDHPSSFLYTMATRLCIDKLRSAAVRHGDGDSLLHEIACHEDMEGRAYARRFLDRIFHRQEESTRVMAVLHYVDGMTFEEVGAQVKMSAAGVRRRMEKLKSHVAGMAAPVNGMANAMAGKESP
jgi:RNA polymerase sigma-70 factor, ECF subfamily